ncbi:hypothetical protein F8M49_22305 [Rhodococcus zopfii]|uniref:Uncharacterized protein n=1 Tax=Rhodococcus zopfii TaxID=43772 RepID=A0ABU3WT30_9NOCA|nr:hypothetical protein [Rhodococcus zopfii]MDV2477389.1 hypothetical protein [Rhodococcus zopfii]MDV2477436.1 hypothetical protein [Rhodococcus zopfii]
MSAPLTPTPNDAAAAAQAAQQAAPAPTGPPQPAVPAQPPAGGEPAPAPDAPKADEPLSHEAALKELEKVRREAANYRTQVRELEPLAKAQRDLEDAQKTDLEREREQNQQLREQLEAAERTALVATHQIPEEYQALVTGSTPEERAASAQLVGQLIARTQQQTPAPTAPPSQRPLEGLTPGASPTPPAQPDHSYPASWLPTAGTNS